MSGPSPKRDTIVGVVLAGGRSRRMFKTDGRAGDKGFLDIAGKPMLGHVIERLRPQVAGLAINANGNPDRFAAFGLPVVTDPIEGFAGPLAGLLAGMRWAARHAPLASHIATVSSDVPFLPRDLVSRLAEALTPDTPIVLAKSGGEFHPVIGLWSITLADDLEAQLRGGQRKVLAWTDRHGTRTAEFAMVQIGSERVDPFFNANTPADLDEARWLMALTADP